LDVNIDLFLADSLIACSNSVQLVPLHPIVMSILFHHYKELRECISEVGQIEAAGVVSNRHGKRTRLTEKQEQWGEEQLMGPS
jgi:hypothetical protein